MDDLISRKYAIRAIIDVGRELIAENVMPLGAVTDFSDAIRQLPSAAKPDGDLISRQDAIKELLSLNDQCNSVYYTKCIDDAVYALDILPSAQPEPKTGEWILTDFPDEQTYKCSACNEHWTFIEGTPYDNGAFFCPNCGARMEGSE